jgi:hypothetical protein
MRYWHKLSWIPFLLPILGVQGARAETRGVESGNRYDRLLITNVIVIDGKGTPPRGPVDITLNGNLIESVASADHDATA